MREKAREHCEYRWFSRQLSSPPAARDHLVRTSLLSLLGQQGCEAGRWGRAGKGAVLPPEIRLFSPPALASHEGNPGHTSLQSAPPLSFPASQGGSQVFPGHICIPSSRLYQGTHRISQAAEADSKHPTSVVASSLGVCFPNLCA